MVDEIEKFYRAPTANVDMATSENADKIWRKSSAVVVTRETIWPKRCIKCNSPTDKSLHRTLVYVNPWIYLTILINLLITLILGLIFQKKFKMDIPVCEKHIVSRRRVILINWLLSLVFIAGVLLTVTSIYDQGVLIASVALLLILFIGLSNRLAFISKYKEPYIYVRGAKSVFLDSLQGFEQD